MNRLPKVSVIISARNEEEHLAATIQSMVSGTTYSDYEILAINDGSDDQTEDILGKIQLPQLKTLKTPGLGTAKARNFGTRFSKGELLVFSDAHITVPAGWLEKIVGIYQSSGFDVLSVPICADSRGIGDPALIGYAQSLDPDFEPFWIIEPPVRLSAVPVAPGGFVVFRKDVFRDIGGFDSGFNTWGFEDIEISIKIWLMGYKIKVTPDLYVLHHFRHHPPFMIKMSDFLYNRLRTGLLHFNEKRVEKLKELISRRFEKSNYNGRESLEQLMIMLDGTKIKQEREAYCQRRKFTDDWYFERFRIDF